jgi:hypothetical protein
MSGLVLLQSLKNERNTVLRLVIDYLGHLFLSFLYLLKENGEFTSMAASMLIMRGVGL